jgi:hypothetical protein
MFLRDSSFSVIHFDMREKSCDAEIAETQSSQRRQKRVLPNATQTVLSMVSYDFSDPLPGQWRNIENGVARTIRIAAAVQGVGSEKSYETIESRSSILFN